MPRSRQNSLDARHLVAAPVEQRRWLLVLARRWRPGPAGPGPPRRPRRPARPRGAAHPAPTSATAPVPGGASRRAPRRDRARPVPAAGPASGRSTACSAASGRTGPRPAGLRRRAVARTSDVEADRKASSAAVAAAAAVSMRVTSSGASPRRGAAACLRQPFLDQVADARKLGEGRLEVEQGDGPVGQPGQGGEGGLEHGRQRLDAPPRTPRPAGSTVRTPGQAGRTVRHPG